MLRDLNVEDVAVTGAWESKFGESRVAKGAGGKRVGRKERGAHSCREVRIDVADVGGSGITAERGREGSEA
jgi:hypothetical protein